MSAAYYDKADPVLGIDIGGTHIRMGLVDDKYQLQHFSIRKSQEVLLDESKSHLSSIALMGDLVKEYLTEVQAKISAVSIGFPSTIDAKREVVVSTPNIKPLQNLKVVEELGGLLELPVFINRDVNYILLSDLEDLKDNNLLNRDPESVCGFYIGTGLGNTIMINGRLLTGAHGYAAELGHIHIIGNNDSCGCGGVGCIELMTGGLALAKIREKHFPDTYIGDLFKLHADTEPLKQYIDNLAVAVTTEMVLIDPEVNIFGGGVMQMEGFPRAYFEQRLYAYARRPCPEGSLKFIYVKESQSGGVRGAGIYAYKRLKESNYL